MQNIEMKLRRYFLTQALLLSIVACGFNVSAQIFPVTVNANLQPPSSTYFSDFTTPGSEKLKVNLIFNDYNEPDYDVRLKLTITGQGITLSTSPNFQPSPLKLFPGVNALTGSDLEEYLNLANLDVTGTDRQQLQQSGALPEGFYTFCIQVFDYRRGDVALSREGCASSVLRKNNPPIPAFPACGGIVPLSTQQNVLFSWQSNADPMIQAEYELTIVDVLGGIDPNQAINGASTPILDNQLISGTTFNYGPDQVDLEVGHKYAYNITVYDKQGLTTFENNGISDVCWFMYGSQYGDTIALTRPDAGFTFRRTDARQFGWNRPARAPVGQHLSYQIKIVEIEQGQTKEDAMSINSAWWEDETLPNSYPSYTMQVPQEFPFGKNFAWQVTSYYEGQVTAQSSIRTFKTMQQFEKFQIGSEIVYVTSVSNPDPVHFSGTGQIDLTGNGSMVDLEYSNLQLYASGNDYLVEEGTLNSPVQNIFIDLDNQQNGKAQFEVQRVKIGRATNFALRLNGRVKWQLPHPVQGSDTAIVYSGVKDFVYPDRKLTEEVNFDATSFELLDPYGFQLSFLPASKFTVVHSVVTLTMNGTVSPPKNLIKDNEGNRVSIPFAGVDNPYYFTNTNITNTKGINIASKTTVTLDPQSVTFDLSEEQTPAKVSTDPFWKGLVFDKFNLNFPKEFDGSGQLKLAEVLTDSYTFADNAEIKSWADPAGLMLHVSRDFQKQDNDYGFFNTFLGQFYNYKIDIANNDYNEGELHGFIRIPVLSDSKEFAYTAYLNEAGFQTGFLDEKLDGTTNTFNKDDDIAEMKLTVRQGHFEDNDHLVMAIDMDWVGLHSNLQNVNNFKVWGNAQIGFTTPGGSVNIQMANGSLDGYGYSIQSVAAQTVDGSFEFKTTGNIDFGTGVTGVTGPPQTSVVCRLPADKQVTPVPRPTEASIIPFPIKIYIPGLVKIETGPLGWRENDPVYGRIFTASGSLAVEPFDLSLGAIFKMGKAPGWSQDHDPYWFFQISCNADAGDDSNTESDSGDDKKEDKNEEDLNWVNNPLYEPPDKSGENTPPSNDDSDGFDKEDAKDTSPNKCFLGRKAPKLGELDVQGFGGRIYRYMDHATFGAVKDIDYIPSDKVEFGAMIFLNGQHWKSEGLLFQYDAALEMNGGRGTVKTLGGEFTGTIMAFDLLEHMKEGGASAPPGVQVKFDGFSATGTVVYDIPDKHFILTLEFEGKNFICASGKGKVEVKPGLLEYNLGSYDEKVQFTPGCYGLGFMGWLEGDDKGANLGLGASLSITAASPWLEVGIGASGKIRPWASAGVGLGGSADITYKPLAINNIGVWVDAWAGIYCDYEFSYLVGSEKGTWTLAEARLTGNLLLYFQPEKKLTGTLNGSAEIVRIKTNFSLNLDKKLD